jgi:tetratricopeptide (TPR) repeat protein
MNRKDRRAAARTTARAKGRSATSAFHSNPPDVSRLFADAVARHLSGDFTGAVVGYRQILKINPRFAEAYSNLGGALFSLGDLDPAIEACSQAIALEPDRPEAFNNLGSALFQRGHIEQAITACRQAVKLKPDFALAQDTLGSVLKGAGQIGDAVRAYEQAIALQPDNAAAHLNYAQALLLQGRLREGWAEYAWRWKTGKLVSRRMVFPQAEWSGEPLVGKTILLHAEQGFGDALQFARFGSVLAALGGRVILGVFEPLTRLLRSVPGIAGVIGH